MARDMAADRDHVDDFDYDGAEWICITTLGSRFEEQLDTRSASGEMRHRSCFDFTAPWKRGPAPREKVDG